MGKQDDKIPILVNENIEDDVHFEDQDDSSGKLFLHY